MKLTIALNSLSFAQKAKLSQLLILNLAIFIEFVYNLKTKPFDVSKMERRLRIWNQYVISLCFMNLPFYVGRYIEGDLSEEGIQDLVFEGFLYDEIIHYKYGKAQTTLFMLLAATSLVMLLKSFTKVLTIKRLKYTYKSFWVCLVN